jgi:MFS family permease
MLLLDVTIAVVALPDMARALHASLSDLQWVIDGYALALAALLLGVGAAADILGRRRVHVAGVVLFAVASLLCGLASGPGMLVAARGLQGCGGDARDDPAAARLGLPGAAAVDGARGVGRGQRRRRGGRAGARRAAHRGAGLAVDLLREPAGERGLGVADAAGGAGVAGSARDGGPPARAKPSVGESRLGGHGRLRLLRTAGRRGW